MTIPRSRHAVLPAGVCRIDRRAGRRLYRSPTPQPVNEAFTWLSAAAENGFFWVLVVALVALSGRRGRRSAVRGSLTLATASLSANLVAKKLIRARRPVARGLRHGLRHVRTPNSPAFPSRHGATAAALTAGVAIESPARGGVIGVLALLISYSRLHVGAHEVSDVVAGNAYGALVGVLGFLVRRP